MIKLFIKLSLVFSLFLTFVAQAGLLSSSEYVVFKHDGDNYDVTWASSVNSERTYINSNYDFNTLLAPTTHQGWAFAGLNGMPSIIDIFKGSSTNDILGVDLLNKFTNDDGSLIHSFSHWNDLLITPGSQAGFPGEDDLFNTNYQSQWSWSVPSDDDIDNPNPDTALEVKKAQRREIAGIETSSYATFYIRKTETTPVPEPSTLMIFALGLIALASKNRLFS